ncbi:hypothetical protein [Litorilituus lipolyticus]|uniref:Porin n=1 Tax=Litorilituus lipolyticus TaxID=2491017 RepID=A0A502KYH4_9GAMM|nr:hypothetical protein [Litorilituus lipolyticus]TPH13247.1 hypothetical protein EPA86_13720 [Litorilituus lipolyticus]
MSVIRPFIISGLILLCSDNSYAESLTFSGYLKSYALAQDSLTIESMDTINNDYTIAGNGQSQNALRLMASYISPEQGNFELHYEVQPLYFSNTEFAKSSGGLGATISIANTQYRFKDFDALMSEVGDNAVILQNLDRLNYQYSNQYGDLTIGRQVLSFGSSRFINPTDIFIPFVIQTLNQEYRVGIDAIRYTADIDDFSILDMGVIIGEDGKKQHSAAFLRTKNSIAGNDIELMAIALDDAWLLGGGLERAIGDFGFWFETAFMRWQQKPVDNNLDNTVDKDLTLSHAPTLYTDDYWRTSVGSDYALNEDIILMLEYHYNGAGSKDTSKYHELAQQAPYQQAGVFLLGQHYLIPAVTWLASPLMTVNTSAFYNIDDRSIFINISSETSWSDNLYSDFGVFLTHGDNLQYQVENEQNQLQFTSEFGAYPLSIYASLRYYF